MKAVAIGLRAFTLTLVCLHAVQGLSAETSPQGDASPREVRPENHAQWIWSPSHTKDEVPVGDCYFRKTFQLAEPAEGQIQIVADNQFELLVNGQPAGRGEDWRQMQVLDISALLRKGKNVIAVRVTNTDAGAAGLAARLIVRSGGGTFEGHLTDASWKTSVRRFQRWTQPDFPDQDWVDAIAYGTLGATLPWGDEVVVVGQGSRFNLEADFAVERMMRDDEVGSLIAMTFDSRGNIIASQEGGHLLLLADSDGNGTHDTVTTYSSEMKNVQGLLALGLRLFAVGEGPEGSALYMLRDSDRDGVADEIKVLVPFQGSKGEHGPHAIRLGPDGLLYVIVGNHARVGVEPSPRSPFRHWVEGDLVTPRYEDPRGHAVGIPAPGGTIFRTDTAGSFVELVAGGLRNSYDFAFNADGEMFTYDADMEWDRGAPWYRPTRINHVTAGAELGWRSGWAKWPDYYLDSLPPTIEMGAGSPTGVEFYNHTAYPEQFRGAMFGCDWATGRIHCVRMERDGASYQATSEVFLAGKPLNATDLAVGPDGAIYFCTGGRGTDGGLYRVRWTGEPPADAAKVETGIELALHQPQLDADWARAKIATVKRTLGDAWATELAAVVRDPKRPIADRLRSVDLMVFFGPRPSESLLLALAEDAQPELRAKAARLMASVASSNATLESLSKLLSDRDALVRRNACETAAISGLGPTGKIVALLADEDKFVAFAARRALEGQLAQRFRWTKTVLGDPRPQLFCQGAVALLTLRSDSATAQAILKRCQHFLTGPTTLKDNELVDVLRVAELALARGEISAESVPQLSQALLEQYPSENHRANRELVRLLVYLQVPEAAKRFSKQLQAEIPAEEKLHIGAYAPRLAEGWNTDSKLVLLRYYEQSRTLGGGYSVGAYLEHFARDFFGKLTINERRHILGVGEKWPSSALSILASLPAQPGEEILAGIRDLDGRVRPLCNQDDVYRRLRVGTIAVLGRSGEQASLKYLHRVFDDEPEQRSTVAMSLAQHPGKENWKVLIRSLSAVDGTPARDVLAALTTVKQRPNQAEPYRHVILLGLRLGDEGAADALRLLNHWSNQSTEIDPSDWKERLAAWQKWYAENFPDSPPAELPADEGRDRWTYEEILSFLESPAGATGNIASGEKVFASAQCIKCHRFGSQGEVLGPDLTDLAKRFQKKEILESIVYPSHVISDQYASRIVVSNGRSFGGLVVSRGQEGVTVLLSDGTKMNLEHDQIEEIRASAVSVMPSGLLNSVTLQQVADLFAFLYQGEGLAKPPATAGRLSKTGRGGRLSEKTR